MFRSNHRKNDGEEKSTALWRRRGFPVFVLIAVIIAGLAVFFALAARRGAAGGKPLTYSELLMDTGVELQVFSGAREGERVKEALFDEMKRLEQLLSYRDSESEVAAINRAAGKKPVAVSPETAAVIREALAYAEISGGAFDPTIAPLLEAWGFQEGDYRVPGPEELQEAAGMVDYRLVEAGEKAVRLARPGMALDLGGIAKGYIVDRGLDLLERRGVSHALINAGGDVGILGPKADGSPWRVGVKHPRNGTLLAVIPWDKRGAIVTSGDYERFFEKDGSRYHHILDPQTGEPAPALTSVTVVAPTAVQADALSTAVFVLGPERGLALVEELPGVEALLVDPQFALLVSSGLRGLVEPPGGTK